MAKHATKARTDVGQILVQVQEDLKELKENLSQITIQTDGKTLDIQSLETAIHRTEIGLKRQAAEYLNSINRQVLTLPAVEYKDLPAGHSLADTIPANSKIIKKHESYPSLRKKYQGPRLGNAPQHTSPGIQHKMAMDVKILRDPTHPKNRSLINENYGLQFPIIRNALPEIPSQKLAKGTTISPIAVLPPAHRQDPSLLPPFVSEKDARKGILSLTERGLIPQGSELTLAPSPIQHKLAIMHDCQEKYKKPPPEIYGSYPQKSYYIVISESGPEEPKPLDRLASKPPLNRGTVTPAPSVMTTSSMKDYNAAQRLLDKEIVPYDFHEPKEFQVVPLHQPHKFPRAYYVTIFSGTIDYTAPDFQAFKQRYQLYWRHIFTFLEYLAMKLRKYDVPVAIVEGEKLAKISVIFDLDSQPTWEQLLPALKNKDLVEDIVMRPGQQYKGPDGMVIAATKIQAIWRQYLGRTKYLASLRQKWAAGVIAISWLMHAQMSRVKKTLKQSRQRHLENFRSRAKHLAANWNCIKASRRTIIHIPSLGYARWLRSTVPDIDTQQNLQMGRLCEIKDDNVDVIYICPLWIGEDVTQYYMKLLGLQESVKSGKPEAMVDMTNRLKVITPEATIHFTTHHLCLATHLKYSPQAIKRIKNLIEGKPAYIVGGLLHQDDLAVADMLNVPILGPEPEVAHLYSTKSGSKRIFTSASVPMPPGEYDIYRRQQMREVLIQLIIENLEIKRWLFKVDTEFGGRGTAYFDVTHLACYHQTLMEFKKVGPTIWLKSKWMQEPAEIKMAKELPGVLAEHAQPVNQEIFPTWEKFLKMFLCQGGVVEAYPPSDSVTNLTVDMLIEPTGEISMVSCGDQIHSTSPLECWGTTVPQCSVDPSNLHSMCVKIAEACKCRGMIGFFSIDLVTFIHPHTMEQQVWATDLDLAYSNQLAMTQLMLFISHGNLACEANTFEVPPKLIEQKRRLRRHEVAKEVQTQTERQGTVFILHEGNKRDRLGMVTIGEDLQGALLTFARNLSVIHQEITAPNVQWENNFQAAIQDIETILGVTIANKSQEGNSILPSELMI
ncbi:IQ domain-containing protein H isoform X2 [Amblyraja radiata]|uniref:IQ domain-containing protein H isoform X2 n=1 Tax=Amblyraja radiata TaxID=386614 RepID=UPI00140423BB|nr:IQ domain-containing protein H isoform X2 [Amblyraja radiata]